MMLLRSLLLPALLVGGAVGARADEVDVDRLLDARGTPAAERRALAERAAEALPASRVLELEPALADPDAGVRAAVARLFGRGDLGTRGGPERVRALEVLAGRDPAAPVRAAAIVSLGALGDDGAADALARLVVTAPTAEDRGRAAEALAAAPAGGPRLAGLVRAALGGRTPVAASEARVLAALLPRYGRGLADLARAERTDLVPLIAGLSHPDTAVRRAAGEAVDGAIARLVEIDERGRATELFGRLSALGLDPALALYQSARLALVAEHDPRAALARARELSRLRGLRLRPTARIDAYESQLWLYRGLALMGAAHFALGELEAAEDAFTRAAAVLDRGLAERRDLASPADRLVHADLLAQRAAAELFRTVVAIAKPGGGAQVLEHARRVHTAHLEAQAVAASVRGDAIAGFDNLLLSDLAPHTLVLDGDGFAAVGGLGRRRLLALAEKLGRALATVAPGEMPGFLPRTPEGLAPDVRARLVDPLVDPERERALLSLRRARLDGLDAVIEEAQELVEALREHSVGLVPEKEAQDLQQLLMHRRVLQRIREEEEPGDRTWLRDLRIPSSAALWLAEDFTAEGRTDEARALAEEMERDIDARGISNWWYLTGHDRVIRARLLVGSALTDDGQGGEAESVLLGAVERVEDLERELEGRGADGGQLDAVRGLLSSALVSLAVNANVRLGDPGKAERYYERAYALRKDEFMRALLACYRARSGRADEARGLVRTIRPGPGTWYNLACTHALLGDTERALDLLEAELTRNHATAESRRRQAEWARADPDLASLRGEPRFDRLTSDR